MLERPFYTFSRLDLRSGNKILERNFAAIEIDDRLPRVVDLYLELGARGRSSIYQRVGAEQ